MSNPIFVSSWTVRCVWLPFLTRTSVIYSNNLTCWHLQHRALWLMAFHWRIKQILLLDLVNYAFQVVKHFWWRFVSSLFGKMTRAQIHGLFIHRSHGCVIFTTQRVLWVPFFLGGEIRTATCVLFGFYSNAMHEKKFLFARYLTSRFLKITFCREIFRSPRNCVVSFFIKIEFR